MDATFYIVMVLAVMLVGFGKGGMGDVLGLLGVPILTFVMPSVQAAAILLPILIVMDVIALWTWRAHWHRQTLLTVLPGALIGIAIGWTTFYIVPDYVMRLLIGIVALSFTARFFYNRYLAGNIEHPPRPNEPVRATIWGTLSGYGSFIAHAGGAPYQVYALPLQLSPKEYTGTAVRFFAIVNALKLPPYYMLGLLSAGNLQTSALLFPVALLATLAGAAVVKRMRMEVFYPWMYGMLMLAGLKLSWDGVRALAAVLG
ncbi:sulfite exporter TauE/SafE family protein [Rhizobium sp.]